MDSPRNQRDCKRCKLRTQALFSGISADWLEALRGTIEDRHLSPSEALYQIEERGSAIYTVRRGTLKLVRSLPSGDYRIVRLAGRGDVIGLEALIGEPYHHDAVALEECRLCRLPIGLIEDLALSEPALGRELLHRWQRALSEADTWLTELSIGSARQRMSRLLLRLCDVSGTGRNRLFSRDDIAAILGITKETASRTIAELKRDGLLIEGRDGFSCDRTALQRIAAQ